jgi:hypothetical protein
MLMLIAVLVCFLSAISAAPSTGDERALFAFTNLHDHVTKQHKTEAEHMATRRNTHKSSLDYTSNVQTYYKPNTGAIVSSGYFLKKTRSNSDCSGPITFVTGHKLFCDRPEGSEGYRDVCYGPYGNNGPILSTFYHHGLGTPDCSFTNNPSPSESVTETQSLDFNTCSYVDSYSRGGLNKMAVQCSSDTDVWRRHDGIQWQSFVESSCQGSPRDFTTVRFGVCLIQTWFRDSSNSIYPNNNQQEDNLENRNVWDYGYFMYDNCQSDGTIRVTEFADHRCTKKLTSGTVNLKDVGAVASNFNTCVAHGDGVDSTRVTCIYENRD